MEGTCSRPMSSRAVDISAARRRQNCRPTSRADKVLLGVGAFLSFRPALHGAQSQELAPYAISTLSLAAPHKVLDLTLDDPSLAAEVREARDHLLKNGLNKIDIWNHEEAEKVPDISSLIAINVILDSKWHAKCHYKWQDRWPDRAMQHQWKSICEAAATAHFWIDQITEIDSLKNRLCFARARIHLIELWRLKIAFFKSMKKRSRRSYGLHIFGVLQRASEYLQHN
eukprot:Blabericola_migrator_1__7467@NODE_3810_length_1492_cov_96_936842_g2363_i0_p1_GENE_NODE_3810_length_1492_cov_96_936842_g2363_i0NODE_3810_length_1492_cov_96_936842_g2363_i0_p1_ORF_typecomplete_len227_score24_77_NODE_3810_length_1492_cov_96_936842_g2363_i06241304